MLTEGASISGVSAAVGCWEMSARSSGEMFHLSVTPKTWSWFARGTIVRSCSGGPSLADIELSIRRESFAQPGLFFRVSSAFAYSDRRGHSQAEPRPLASQSRHSALGMLED